MQVHGAGGLAQVAITAEVALEGVDQVPSPAGIGVEQRAKDFLIEVAKFVLLIEMEEEA